MARPIGGNPLACAAGNAVLDVMLAPGFLEEVERKGRKLRAELDKIAREFPTVFVDARGMGLLLGLKCAMPQGEVQAACVAEGLMAITAGDNVLRLAPPLVVTDSDLDQAVAMLRPAAAKWRRQPQPRRRRNERAAPPDARTCEGQSSEQGTGPRHFLDLRDFDTATLRQMLDVASGFKRAGGVTSRPLAGKTLALIFEKPSTRTRVSFEVGMRQLGGDVIVLSGKEMQLGRGETVGRHGARAVALCRCDHAAHRQARRSCTNWRNTRRCR